MWWSARRSRGWWVGGEASGEGAVAGCGGGRGGGRRDGGPAGREQGPGEPGCGQGAAAGRGGGEARERGAGQGEARPGRGARPVRGGWRAGKVSDLLSQVVSPPAAMGDVRETGVVFVLRSSLRHTHQVENRPRRAFEVSFPRARWLLFLPLLSFWAPLFHCPVQAVLRAKYQQAIDLPYFHGLFIGTRFVSQRCWIVLL